LIANRMLIIDKGKKIVEGVAADLFDPAQTIVELDTIDPRLPEKPSPLKMAALFTTTQAGKFILKMDRS